MGNILKKQKNKIVYQELDSCNSIVSTTIISTHNTCIYVDCLNEVISVSGFDCDNNKTTFSLYPNIEYEGMYAYSAGDINNNGQLLDGGTDEFEDVCESCNPITVSQEFADLYYDITSFLKYVNITSDGLRDNVVDYITQYHNIDYWPSGLSKDGGSVIIMHSDDLVGVPPVVEWQPETQYMYQQYVVDSLDNPTTAYRVEYPEEIVFSAITHDVDWEKAKKDRYVYLNGYKFFEVGRLVEWQPNTIYDQFSFIVNNISPEGEVLHFNFSHKILSGTVEPIWAASNVTEDNDSSNEWYYISNYTTYNQSGFTLTTSPDGDLYTYLIHDGRVYSPDVNLLYDYIYITSSSIGDKFSVSDGTITWSNPVDMYSAASPYYIRVLLTSNVNKGAFITIFNWGNFALNTHYKYRMSSSISSHNIQTSEITTFHFNHITNNWFPENT